MLLNSKEYSMLQSPVEYNKYRLQNWASALFLLLFSIIIYFHLSTHFTKKITENRKPCIDLYLSFD